MNNQQHHERRAALRAFGQTLVALAPLVLFYWSIPQDAVSTTFLDLANATLPLYFITVTSYLGYRLARCMNGAIWTPLVWFPVQSAVFYGFGPLVEVYGNQFTRSILNAHYLAVTSEDLFRSHQLSVTGITLLLAGYALHIALARRIWTSSSSGDRSTVDPFKLGMVFVLAGVAFKYLVFKPSKWELIDLVVPGVLSSVINVADLGFAILAFCAARGDQRARSVLLVLFPLHILASILSMSKLEILTALLLPIIGAYAGRANARKLFLRLVAAGVVFMISQPYIHHGRSEIYARTGTIHQADYVERAGIFLEYLALGYDPNYQDANAERQGWWTRLNFSGPQARVMDLYDRGLANPQLDQVWMSFIPRVIWTDKPLLYGPGLGLYRQLSENEDGWSSLGLSIYGDLYWQYGWTGVIIGCLMIGWLFGMLSARSIAAVRAQEYLLMPFVLLTLRMGLLAPNKFVINGIIGALPVLIFYFIALSGLIWLMRPKHKRGSAVA